MYIVFDLLALGPYDLRPLPLTERKALLVRAREGQGRDPGARSSARRWSASLRFCEREHLEGMVAKRADSPYVSGPRRTGDWIKIKCDKDEEFVVIGFTVGEGGANSSGRSTSARTAMTSSSCEARWGAGSTSTPSRCCAKGSPLDLATRPAKGDARTSPPRAQVREARGGRSGPLRWLYRRGPPASRGLSGNS